VPCCSHEKKPVVQKQLVVEDTYDDPSRRLAALQKALFTASVKNDKGSIR